MDTNVGMNYSFPADSSKIIKVIGIGGGGVNAVNYMYECGIHGVNFAVCNTDRQSFQGVNVPVKVTLGDGLGAGGKPEKAREDFNKSAAEVEKLLDDGTQMVFIAAGLGGGTGSGASPLLAKMAKDRGILTVGIVTIPFRYEMIPRINKALDSVEEMSRNVDSLIVINNQRLVDCYPDLDVNEAFKKTDEVLAMAVKSIAETITVKGEINRDFNDVKTMMKDGGVALVSYGFGRGENRLEDAIQEALGSPLLSNNDIGNAKRVLFYLSYRKDAHVKIDELHDSATGFMSRFDQHIDTSWGHGIDDSLSPEQEVKFMIIATGFSIDAIPEMKEKMDENEILKVQKESEQRKRDEERVNRVYGESPFTKVKVNRVSQSSIVVLTADEMDDDAFIGFMEKTPTYSRKSKEIAANRKPPQSAAATGEPATVSPDAGEKSGGVTVIEF